MACELDSTKLSRREVFDEVLSHILRSQEPEIGQAYKTLEIVALVISIATALIIIVLTVMSGYKKGYNEEDGFFEVYDEYRRTALIVSLMLLAIMLLSGPFTYEVIMVMLETMKDVDFFKNSMPKLEGCIDEYNIKEALAVSKEKTFDQLIMIYVQVGLSSGSVLFCLLNLFAAWIRRCCDNSLIEKEYNMQMAAIKARNEDFDVISKETDGSFRNSLQSSKRNNGSQRFGGSIDISTSGRGKQYQKSSSTTKIIKLS